jgi:hypothetical protein
MNIDYNRAPVERRVRRQCCFDGDFRREPKTDIFCAVCQRDIKFTARRYFVWLDEPFCDGLIIHPEDIIGTEIIGLVGPECRKKIKAEFLMTEPPSR